MVKKGFFCINVAPNTNRHKKLKVIVYVNFTLCVLCFKKPLPLVGLRHLLPSAFSVLKIKIGQKKWRVWRLIIKSEDLISFKSILWETATHQCQLCLLLESIIFLKSYLILWKCNLYNMKCKQTFPEKTRFAKRDYTATVYWQVTDRLLLF